MTDTTDIRTSQLDNASGAVVRYNGAVRDFTNAVGTQALYSGLISDELGDSRALAAVADRRTLTAADEEPGASFPYPELSTARLEALRAIRSFQQYFPKGRPYESELYSYMALVETYFAEDMCSGVPLGTLDQDNRPAFGLVLSRGQLLERALQDLDSAATTAVDSTGVPVLALQSLAAVVRGRVLLDSGNVAAAAAAVGQVAPDFMFAAAFNGAVQQNNVAANFANFTVTVSDHEGQNGLDFVSAGDPRVLAGTNPGHPFPLGPQALFIPDTSLLAPIALATGVEARLIRAEAALAGGDATGWSDTLNALRAAFPDTALSNHPLPPDSTTTVSAATRLYVQFRERAFWLFLSGHRQGDLRRLIRLYGLPTEVVFPTGLYAGAPGLDYGHDVTFVPNAEDGNPTYHGCIDRNP